MGLGSGTAAAKVVVIIIVVGEPRVVVRVVPVVGAFFDGLLIGVLLGVELRIQCPLFLLDGAGQPDTDLIEDVERDGEEHQRHDVLGRRDDGGENGNGDDGVLARLLHHLIAQEIELHEGHDDDGQFKGDAKNEDEARGEGDVVTQHPDRFEAFRVVPQRKEFERAGKDGEVREKDPGQEKTEADA